MMKVTPSNLSLEPAPQWLRLISPLGNLRLMKIHLSITCAVVAVMLLAGCAGSKQLQHQESLRRDRDWPKIRAAAELEVARHEGNTLWSHDAYFTPQEHTNGVWYVVAAGAYPLNGYGDSIDILLRDGGEILSYLPRRDFHPK
jgi:hypothetical protein